MSTPQLTGLASGIDTDSIVQQIMASESQGRTRLTTADAQQASRQTQLQDLATKLGAVRDAASALRSATLWTPTQAVTSSDSTHVDASRVAGAAPGDHVVTVQSLASSSQRVFDYTPSAAASTITIGSFSLNVDANTDAATLAGAINDRTDAPVSAVVAGGKLVLTSRTTGAASAFTVDGGGTLAENATGARAGADAAYTLDGLALTSASNVVTDGVLGLSMTLKAPTTSPVAISVGAPGPDATAIQTKIQAFVDAYNAAGDLIRGKLAEQQVVNPQSDDDAVKGLFFGDSMLTSVLSNMRSSIGDLSSLGISTGATTGTGTVNADAVSGRLTFDTTAFATALTADPASVRDKISGDNGLGANEYSVINPVAGDRITEALSDAAANRKDIADQLAITDTRLAARQATLKAQFAAMEAAMAANQAALAQLQAQLK